MGQRGGDESGEKKFLQVGVLHITGGYKADGMIEDEGFDKHALKIIAELSLQNDRSTTLRTPTPTKYHRTSNSVPLPNAPYATW